MRNLVGIWCNLFRVLEIAKVGNYSVRVILDAEYSKGASDYRLIKEFCKGWFENFDSQGQLNIELHKTDYSGGYHSETLHDIEARVQKAKVFEKPSIVLDSVSETLLRTATERINLSLDQIEFIKDVAATIAQMAYSNRIRVEHVAEAIQYVKSYLSDNVICPENEQTIFGDKIFISNFEIEKDVLEEAIAFLNEKLKKAA